LCKVHDNIRTAIQAVTATPETPDETKTEDNRHATARH
jgi:hypothetical protein